MKNSNKFKALLAAFLVVCALSVIFLRSSAPKLKGPDLKQADLRGSCEPEELGKTEAPIEENDTDIAEAAVKLCFNGKMPEYAMQNAMTLLSVERKMEIPFSLRGMTLAAACRESMFNSRAEGDHRFSRDGKTPMAIGILQMWPMYERAYGVDRRSVTSSAEGWLKHIKRQVTPAAKRCKPKTVEENWRIAWVTGIRAPKKGGRCAEYASHWFFWKKIQKELDTIKRERENGNQSHAQASEPKAKNQRG